MSGRRKFWLRLALARGVPVRACQHSTPAHEFYEYCEYFRQLDEQEAKWHGALLKYVVSYLAQIAVEVRRSWVDPHKRSKVKLKDFALTFSDDGDDKKSTETNEAQKLAQMQHTLKTYFEMAYAIGKSTKSKHGKL